MNDPKTRAAYDREYRIAAFHDGETSVYAVEMRQSGDDRWYIPMTSYGVPFAVSPSPEFIRRFMDSCSNASERFVEVVD